MRLELGLVLVALGSTPVMAQQVCDTRAYPLSAPTSRFVDNGDGTVTDSSSHMMWMRCSLGQTWTNSTCAGAATPVTWQASMDAADAVNKQAYAKHVDWRMPRITELATIAERQCANPRTNITIFPNTPAAFYWTASNRHGHGNENQAFMLSFGPEGTGGGVKDEKHFARLVRASP
jgi:hypothetical protein